MNPTQRPAGVTFSSILLFLLAAPQMLGLAFLLIGIFAVLHGYPAANPDMPNPGPVNDWMRAIFIVMAAVSLLFILWTIACAVGLLRLRNWARIGTLILAGCIAVYALFSLFGTAVTLFLPPALPPTSPPQTLVFLHLFLALSALFHLLLMALAIWWLVYFNRAAIRTAFQPASAYLPPALLATSPWPVPDSAAPQPPTPVPASRRLFPPAPVAITVIGWLSLIGPCGGLLCCFLPFPAFFFGLILTGPAKIVLYVALAVIMAAIGWNLLQLREPARRAAIAISSLWVLHSLLVFIPAYARRMADYTTQIVHSISGLTFSSGQGSETYFVVAQPHIASLIIGTIFGLAFNLAIIWLLHHYRFAFRHPATSNEANPGVSN